MSAAELKMMTINGYISHNSVHVNQIPEMRKKHCARRSAMPCFTVSPINLLSTHNERVQCSFCYNRRPQSSAGVEAALKFKIARIVVQWLLQATQINLSERFIFIFTLLCDVFGRAPKFCFFYRSYFEIYVTVTKVSVHFHFTYTH